MNTRDKMNAKVIAHLIYNYDKDLSKMQVIALAIKITRASDELGIGFPEALKHVINDPKWKVEL